MGVVYKAEDTALHRLVTLKLLSDGHINYAKALSRFQREAQGALALEQLNFCALPASDGSII
jgi:serine/threonine protein kinase